MSGTRVGGAVSDHALLTPVSALQIHHAECELNFLRLSRLLPGFVAGQTVRLGLRLPGDTTDELHLLVLERAPYTATLAFRQLRPVWGGRPFEILVRAYLDARMAEVTGCSRVARLLARYPYPNRRGFARDEKWQLDRLLGEWLSRCLAEGHVLHSAVLAATG
jgi:hypothetical protein